MAGEAVPDDTWIRGIYIVTFAEVVLAAAEAALVGLGEAFQLP